MAAIRRPRGRVPPGARKIVEVAGRSIGAQLGGEFFALRNRCPHQRPLCGPAACAISATGPGDYVHERPGEMVRGPWHAWEFDIRTGQSWFDPERTRVKAYAVEVRSGQELLDEPPAPGLVPGPYEAETYPVRVQEDYVVVEVGRT